MGDVGDVSDSAGEGVDDGVGDMAAVAERLRLVRAARRRFLRMWTIDRTMVDPLVDRLAADLTDGPGSMKTADGVTAPPHPEAPPADES